MQWRIVFLQILTYPGRAACRLRVGLLQLPVLLQSIQEGLGYILPSMNVNEHPKMCLFFSLWSRRRNCLSCFIGTKQLSIQLFISATRHELRSISHPPLQLEHPSQVPDFGM